MTEPTFFERRVLDLISMARVEVASDARMNLRDVTLDATKKYLIAQIGAVEEFFVPQPSQLPGQHGAPLRGEEAGALLTGRIEL